MKKQSHANFKYLNIQLQIGALNYSEESILKSILEVLSIKIPCLKRKISCLISRLKIQISHLET